MSLLRPCVIKQHTTNQPHSGVNLYMPTQTLEELLRSGNMQSLGWQVIYVWSDVWSGDLQA